jgi:hypothetical protein
MTSIKPVLKWSKMTKKPETELVKALLKNSDDIDFQSVATDISVDGHIKIKVELSGLVATLDNTRENSDAVMKAMLKYHNRCKVKKP